MKINEIFESIQGEGYFTGTPSVFVRLSGCNLNCSFCDTKHDEYSELSIDEIIEQIKLLKKHPNTLIVITGGEPTLQYDELLILLQRLHDNSEKVQLETNGLSLTKEIFHLCHVTLSPKHIVKEIWCDEIKLLYPCNDVIIKSVLDAKISHKYIQPIYNVLGEPQDLDKCFDFCKKHNFKLSIQMHKYLNIR